MIVGSCGGAGAITRFAISTWMNARFPTHLGVGTLLVNVIGCLMGGVLLAILEDYRPMNETLRLALMVGFLGGLTTFSAFGCEIFQLLRDHRPAMAAAFLTSNLVLGLAGVAIGFFAARAVG